MVLVGEAPAGPAENRDSNGLEGFDDVETDPADVRDRAFLADPEPSVDAAAQMFGE